MEEKRIQVRIDVVLLLVAGILIGFQILLIHSLVFQKVTGYNVTSHTSQEKNIKERAYRVPVENKS